MTARHITRRQFLAAVAAGAGSAAVAGSLAAQAPEATPQQASSASNVVMDPSGYREVRRPPKPGARPVLTKEQSDALEHQLGCACPCTLDVFTCRTTDFSCTYSPKLHREVLALRNEGMSAQQVIDAFVDKYGEKALMAPKPKGFNLAGYLVPGAVITAAGAALAFVIGRRRAVAATPAGSGAMAPVDASPEELDRLRRALDEVED